LEKDCVQQREIKGQKVKAYFLYKEKMDEDLYFYSALPKNMSKTLQNVYVDIQGKTFTKKDFSHIAEIKPKNKTYVYAEKTLLVNKQNLSEYLPDSSLYLSARYLKEKKNYMFKLFNELIFKH
jgi:predicted 2-oxoglutarate/Fe(II)-dependent dioxygenase YbiX